RPGRGPGGDHVSVAGQPRAGVRGRDHPVHHHQRTHSHLDHLHHLPGVEVADPPPGPDGPPPRRRRRPPVPRRPAPTPASPPALKGPTPPPARPAPRSAADGGHPFDVAWLLDARATVYVLG